jgi:hypothetical protein
MTYEEAIQSRQIPSTMSREEYNQAVAQQQALVAQQQGGRSPTGMMGTISDPWGGSSMSPSDVRVIDRFLKIPGMPEMEEDSNLPFIFGELIEILARLNLNAASYKELNRQLSSIMAISEGELNKKWAKDELYKLLSRMIMTMSRTDIPIKNPNLLLMLNTLRQETNQTVQYREGGADQGGRGGILDRVLPWRRNR